ncbi:MAG TPA: tetratricopeptide repeat protein [Abditibacteriaceae bacterium]
MTILPQDASSTISPAPNRSLAEKITGTRRGLGSALLVASSSLLLPLVASVQISPAEAAPERNKTVTRPVPKKRVPAAALAALSRARRLMAQGEETREVNAAIIERNLLHAIKFAPEWIKARRAWARWKSESRHWDEAHIAWRTVLELSPSDREAQNEAKRANRFAAQMPAPSYAIQKPFLVRFGHDLNGSFDEEIGGDAPWWTSSKLNSKEGLSEHSLNPWLETRALAKIAKPKLKNAKVQALPPMPAVSLKAVTDVASEEKPSEKTSQASDVTAQETTVPSVPVVAGVTTIFVPEEDALPLEAPSNALEIESSELPAAPAGVPLAARVALARGRQLAGLIESLPEAETWALTELQRAVDLAPRWGEAHQEMALWQEEHGQWEAAAQSWEKVVEIMPVNVKARLALQNARQLAEAQNLWASRALVTLGHDSSNPVGQGESLTTRVFAAPLPSPDGIEASEASEPLETTPDALLPRTPLNEAVRVEVQAPPIFEGSADNLTDEKVLLAQAVPSAPEAPSAPQVPTAPEVSAPVAPTAPASTDTLVPVAPAPPLPGSEVAPPAVDVGAPVAEGAGVDETVPATLVPVPGASGTATSTPNNSTVNVETVLPGAASLPPRATVPQPKTIKPTTKKTAKKTAKKLVAKKPVAKKPVAKKRVTQATARPKTGAVSRKQAAAAWPWVNRAGRAMQSKDFNTALTNYQRAYALDSTNSYALYGIPNTLLILKRYPEAIAGFKRFLAAYKNHPKGLRGLADAYTFSGQYQEAADLNGQILARNPKDFGAALQAAQVLAWSKKYEESGRFYRMALAVQPSNGEVWTEYAETLSYARDQRSRDAFSRALQLNPQSQRAKLGLANLLSWEGDFASAAPIYSDLLKSDPNNLKVRLALADALTFSNRAALAIPEYEAALKLSPESPEGRLGLGRALTLAGRYDEAIALLTPLTQAQPDNVEALNMLGVAQMSARPGAAVATFESLLKLQDQPAARAATLANIGDLRVKLNQLDEARAAYDEAVRLAPQDNRIALSYARALMRRQLYADAEPLVSTVLQRDPANQTALLLQATMAARTGQNERAAALAEQLQAMPIEVSDDALNLFYALRGARQTAAANRLLAQLAEAPNVTAENLVKVANAVRDTGQEEASYALYQRALQIDPDNVQAHLQLAEAYIRRKEFQSAQKEVDAVLTREPGNVRATVMNATLAVRRDGTDASFENATIVAKSVLESNPNNVEARLLMADVSATRAQFAQAVENYRAVLENQPDNLQARLGLARNLNYLKQVDESIQEYQLLIQRVPDDATIKLELAQVYLDRNRLEEAQRLFVDVLKAANYSLPESVSQLALSVPRRVPGSGEIVSDETRRALHDFAVQESQRQANKNGG